MGRYTIEANGKTYTVEAPSQDEAISAFEQHTAPAPQQDSGGMFQTVDNTVRQIAKGVPFVGSYLDEANAATNAALNPVLGTGAPGQSYAERYAANVAAERARDKAFESAHPIASTGLQVAGGVGSGVGALRAAPTLANAAFGNWGATMLPRVLGGTVTGAAQGAVSGYGASENPDEALAKTGSGALAGGIIGGIAAPVVAGATNAANWLWSRAMANRAGAAMGLPENPGAAAVQRVAANVEADKLTQAGAAAKSAELGPEGMVMDLGRQLQGRAEAVATMPGAGQNRVLDAVEQRVKDTAPRLTQELDTELGKSPNVVELTNKIDAFYRAKTKPAYDTVMANHPDVWDSTLQNLTKRGSIRKAVNDAVELARESGDDVVSPFVVNADGSLSVKAGATPNLAFWDYVKKSLDGRIGALARNPDPDSAGKATLSALMDTKRALVDHLDTLTGGAYAKARNIAADKFAVKEALETGLGIFENKLLPEQFADIVSGMGVVEKAAAAAGARRAIERMKEVAPANMTEGGRQVYREILQGGRTGDTAQKLETLLGKDAADRLVGAASREVQFQSAYDKIAANSRTAVRQQLIHDMQTPQVPDLTVSGVVNRLPMIPVQNSVESILKQGSEKTRKGVADILAAKGGQIDPVVAALLRYNARPQLQAPGGVAAIVPTLINQLGGVTR